MSRLINIFKKIYEEVTEDIFDMDNVRMFLKKLRRKKRMFILCYVFRSAELSKAFGLRNLCYSKISVVMLLGYRIAGISRKPRVTTNKKCPAPKCCIFE